MTDEELERRKQLAERLHEKGLLADPTPPGTVAEPEKNPPLVDVSGELVSEMLLRDRR
jgi:hypothetical protein